MRIVGVQPADGAKIPGIRRWPKEYMPLPIFEPERVECDDGRYAGRGRRNGAEAGAGGRNIRLASRRAEPVPRSRNWSATLDSGTIVFVLCDRGDRYLSSDLYSARV